MANLIFEFGRYLSFFGVFWLLVFGVQLWNFRRGLDVAGLNIGEPDEVDSGPVERGAVDIGGTVHYLRRRDYLSASSATLSGLGERFRERIIWPFYLGIWSFCAGLGLMSITFGFVLFG